MAQKQKPAPATPENLNPYEFALTQFDRAAEFLELDAGTRELLSTPIEIISKRVEPRARTPSLSGMGTA